jgi:transcriptional regulator with XRE-family HTH domain
VRRDDSIAIAFGQRVREMRVERGLTQGHMEKKTGLLRCYLSNVENGKTMPQLDNVVKLADAFDIAPGDFFPRTYSAPEHIALLKMLRTFELTTGEKKLLIKTAREMVR